MRVLMWKKWMELKKQPVKLVLLLLMPAILFSVYHYIFNFSFEEIGSVFPGIVTCFSTLVLFHVEEISYLVFYSVLGIRSKTVWGSNLLFVTITGFLLSECCLMVFGFILKESWSSRLLLNNLFSVCCAACLIGWSTVHYLDYSRAGNVIASIFSLINIISPGILILTSDRQAVYGEGYGIAVVVFVIMAMGLPLYMGRYKSEALCENTKGMARDYYDKIFSED